MNSQRCVRGWIASPLPFPSPIPHSLCLSHSDRKRSVVDELSRLFSLSLSLSLRETYILFFCSPSFPGGAVSLVFVVVGKDGGNPDVTCFVSARLSPFLSSDPRSTTTRDARAHTYIHCAVCNERLRDVRPILHRVRIEVVQYEAHLSRNCARNSCVTELLIKSLCIIAKITYIHVYYVLRYIDVKY